MYWEVYQETEDCELKFALNIFKCGLSRENNGIYNSLSKIPPYTFYELLSRINEYSRVEDDGITANGGDDKRGAWKF